ncbi:MAG: hypothetical protein M1825_003171 [Sarcosagium campestre]|nr:MAG: hypothetical protein M1825_003171 [Sarcosagium campestre]
MSQNLDVLVEPDFSRLDLDLDAVDVKDARTLSSSQADFPISMRPMQLNVSVDSTNDLLLDGETAGEKTFEAQGQAQDRAQDHAHVEVEAEISDSDSDKDGDISLSKDLRAVERRKVQKAKFNSWFSKRAEKIAMEDPKLTKSAVDDEVQSAKYLMGQQESAVIISSPREYQLELFERAKERNIIAVLDTGSGKTLIAVLLLRHIIDQELEDRGTGKAPRISFFLVDCVTLVFQQYAVLECNLDQNIERFCGDMGCDLWSKATWDKHFAENMVIVCTAEVLYQCLMHSFISMDQINLLIFDEAHHAKKNHSYARIIKDFYLAELDERLRPKIFGMTASPVDAKFDVVQSAKELETILHSEIATTSDLQLLQRIVHRPEEQSVMFDQLSKPYETPLHRLLSTKFGEVEILAKSFRYSKEASSKLGSWCADQIWAFTFLDDDSRKLESKVERDFLAKADGSKALDSLETELGFIRDAKKMVVKHSFEKPTLTAAHLSSKVLLLHQLLSRRFERPSNDKCIVFVKKRHTARLLSLLFTKLGTANMRVGTLIGTRSGEIGDLNVSFRQQVVTLMKFRKGQFNCLFATSIAEEGLDIPDCNLVIRFDLYSTLIQYVQSRGRARHANSKYVHMVEKGNAEQLQLVQQIRSREVVMRDFCRSLPADRLLLGNDYDIGMLTFKEKGFRVYVDKESKAKLTYNSSLSVLAHFPHDAETSLQPNYVMSFRSKEYICEVMLPGTSPVHSAIGQPASRKAIAKRSAAFEACLMLRKGQYLDKYLLPAYRKQLPLMRNAQLALNMKKSDSYVMRTKPCIWAESVGDTPTELHLTVIHLDKPENVGRPTQPLGLLTRRTLPSLPRFPLHFARPLTSDVSCTSCLKTLTIKDDRLDAMMAFTLRIFQDLFNKIYEPDVSQMPYFLVPIGNFGQDALSSGPDEMIDWEMMRFIRDNESLAWDSTTPDSFFADRFIVDRYDVPVDSAVGKHMGSILQYSNSLWKKSRAKVEFKAEQPVIHAHRVLHRRNLLDEITEKEVNVVTKCYVCPEPLKLSAIPSAIAAMAYLLPAIMFRLDSYLIALDACNLLELNIAPDLALEAVTKDSDNTEEHQEEQIQFQRGMGRNYERLEFIGDCFLKMATSISLYAQNPDNDEFQYHVKRMLLVCNKNLFNTATKLKLYEFIRSRSFSRRVWYPEEPKLLQGKGFNKGRELQRHVLGDKTIADVCEALIGSALLSYQDEGNFDCAVRAVSVLVGSSDHDMLKWEDYYKRYEKPTYQTAAATRSHIDLAEQVASQHGYCFRHPRLLRSAFIHSSYPFSWEKIPCYQRLEFLGDSLLDMACVNFLFRGFPDRDPQWLTEHKMAMVSNKFLGALCVRLGFHKHLRFNGGLVEHQIRNYVEEIHEAEREAAGAPDYWVHAKSPPKALPDVVEAYIGAVFVDSEFNYAEVEKFFDAHIRPFFKDMSIYDTFANNHPTTFLTNLLTLTLGCDSFRIMAQEIPELANGVLPAQTIAAVMVHEEVVAEGRAASAKNARVRASVNALRVLEGLEPADFRARFACDCAGAENAAAAAAAGGKLAGVADATANGDGTGGAAAGRVGGGGGGFITRREGLKAWDDEEDDDDDDDDDEIEDGNGDDNLIQGG